MSENIARRNEIVEAEMDNTEYWPTEYLRMKDLAIRVYVSTVRSERAKAEKLLAALNALTICCEHEAAFRNEQPHLLVATARNIINEYEAAESEGVTK